MKSLLDFIYLWNPQKGMLFSGSGHSTHVRWLPQKTNGLKLLYVCKYVTHIIYTYICRPTGESCVTAATTYWKKKHSITEVQKMYNSCSKAWEWATSTPVFWLWTSNDLLSSCWYPHPIWKICSSTRVSSFSNFVWSCLKHCGNKSKWNHHLSHGNKRKTCY